MNEHFQALAEYDPDLAEHIAQLGAGRLEFCNAMRSPGMRRRRIASCLGLRLWRFSGVTRLARDVG